MKIYTKAGDNGESSILSGKKLEKCNVVFDVLGTLDELTSVIGLAKVADSDRVFFDFLEEIQKTLMKLMSGISAGNSDEYKISEEETKALENEIDKLYDGKKFAFVLPGETELSARLDFARTVARNAERCIVRAKCECEINAEYFKYINRLSDYLYVAARYADLKA